MKQHLGMLAVIVLAAHFGVAGFAPGGGAKKKKTEVEGTWKFVKGGKDAPKQIAFSGNKFVLTFAGDRVFNGTFTLNTTENPSWMDMKIVSGPVEKYKGKAALCIYEFDGDAFKWCAGIPGRKRRPTEFAEVMGDARLLLGIYKKNKK